MSKPKKPEPNPIETAIGERAKTKETPQEKVHESDIQNPSVSNLFDEPTPPEQIPDEPSHQEMLNLEELNRQTEERLRDDIPLAEEESLQQTVEISSASHQVPKVPIIPVSKPDLQPVTETSSPESPPQVKMTDDESDKIIQEELPGAINEAIKEHKFAPEKLAEYLDKNYPAEDVEFTALKKYIMEDGFVLSTVAFHIVSLCAEPLTTPSTTTWAYKDRAMIPEMVLSLLNQPGYLEGIWPSLKIIMGSNAGNSAWCAGIATTIAFFDIIRSLPTLKELQNER